MHFLPFKYRLGVKTTPHRTGSQQCAQRAYHLRRQLHTNSTQTTTQPTALVLVLRRQFHSPCDTPTAKSTHWAARTRTHRARRSWSPVRFRVFKTTIDIWMVVTVCCVWMRALSFSASQSIGWVCCASFRWLMRNRSPLRSSITAVSHTHSLTHSFTAHTSTYTPDIENIFCK